MAPPLTFTPERADIIVEALRAGVSPEGAAGRARVSRRSLKRWRDRGRAELVSIEDGAEPVESEAPFAAFELDCAQAVGDCEYELVQKVRTEHSWTRWMTMLERRFNWVAVRREQIETVSVADGADASKVFGSDDPADWFRAVHHLDDARQPLSG